jgi:hypothetical protein
MSYQDLEKVVNEGAIPFEVAEKYLSIFLGPNDWKGSLAKLWESSGAKRKDIEERKEFVKKSISCAVLLNYTEKSTIPKPPDNLLYWCSGWLQFKERDWFKMFQELLREDIKIAENRNKAIMLGVIDPIDISPVTRQAFNWLYNTAKDNGYIDSSNSEELKVKFTNLVMAYGGAVVCNIFVSHENIIKNVFNWRSGYFFEREIYKIYTIEQILKIKNLELQKVNQNYVKKIQAK